MQPSLAAGSPETGVERLITTLRVALTQPCAVCGDPDDQVLCSLCSQVLSPAGRVA